MKKILFALILIMLIAIPVSAQTDIFHKTGKRGSDVNITSTDARVVYVHPDGTKINMTYYIDGAPMTVNFNSQSAKKETWGTGNGQGNSDVLVEHDFDNTVNDTLKCTITLKSPHEIYYPYTLQNGVSLVNGGNGNLKFVRDATGSTTDKYKTGVTILAPVAWNKTGGAVPVWYTFTPSQINLNINDAGQEYPITIDPTLIPDIPIGYQNVTSFTYNITAGMGTQTGYQMKFNVTNRSGISGYINGENVIFTNATTRPDMFDVNFTDESSNPLPFWPENNTCSSIGCTFWVKVPTISTGNTSSGKCYYGNASQNGSTMNGYATFPLFDDFIGASLNTTQWYDGGATKTFNTGNGTLKMVAPGTGNYFINTTSPNGGLFGLNYTMVSRVASGHLGGTTYSENFGMRRETPTIAWQWAAFAYEASAPASTQYRNRDTAGASNVTPLYGWSASTYHIVNLKRNVASAEWKIDNANTVTNTGNYDTGNETPYLLVGTAAGAELTTDWIFLRTSVPVEPITSTYSTSATSTPSSTLSASFTQAPNPSSTSQSVAFTDTSTGAPTTWNWTFGDIGGSNTSTSQNPTHTYTTAGIYTVLFNVTNASGSWSNTSATHTVVNASGFTPQDVWMEPQYTHTFHITDSSNGAPIPDVICTDSTSQTYTATNGTCYLTEPFGAFTVYFASTGYTSRAISYFSDADATHDVQLTATTTQQQNTNIIYTPHQVRVYTVDAYGVPLIGTNITINYIASTLPSTDTNWLINAYGIDSAVAADMVNSSIAMTGISADDGSNTFTLFGSLTYGITLTNATVGANCYKKLAPIDASYRIYCPITGQTAVNNTLTAVNTSKLVFYKLNTSSYYNLSMIYEDQTGYTTNLSFNVYDYSAGRTLVYTKNWTGIGTAQVVDNYTVYIPLGKEYQWQFNATKV